MGRSYSEEGEFVEASGWNGGYSGLGHLALVFVHVSASGFYLLPRGEGVMVACCEEDSIIFLPYLYSDLISTT